MLAPATLAAAMLPHVDGGQVANVLAGVLGSEAVGQAMAEVDLADGASYFVVAYDGPTDRRARCPRAATVCETGPSGTLVTLVPRHGKGGVALEGWAYRADETLMLQVVGDHPDVGVATAILEDDNVGRSASPETVDAGQDLDVDDLKITVLAE